MGRQNELSPAMRQYLDMKDEVPNAVLMFRMGDFYESFFGDAARVSKAVDLVLTRRGTDERGVEIPMCGIPWHAADNYFGRLVRQGISVAIADQMETPEEAKSRGHKQIDRRITRVITAGTLTDDNLLAPKKSNYLAAIAGADIAAVDISTGELLVGSSENLFDDLSKLSPAEVLYDERFAETPAMQRIRNAFNTTPLNVRQYDNFEGPNDAEKMIAAYLKQTQRDAALKLSAPRKLWAGDQLLIDANTWKSLEIDAPLNAGGTTLLDIIDRTRTAAGGRKLRQWIRNLSGDAAAIEAGQGHVAHLFSDRGARDEWTNILGRIPDAGRSLSRLESGRGTPRDLRAVSNFLEALPKLKAAGLKLDEALVLRFQGLELFENLAAELLSAVAENLPAFFREGGVIRRGFGAELDEARDLASGAKDAIAALQSKYANAVGTSLKIKYNGVIGYYIEVASKNAAPLTDPKSGFIHRQTMSDNMRFTTAELSELDSKVKNAAGRAGAIEQEIISRLLEHIAEKADGIGGAADLAAEIDVYAALANVAADMNWVRPKIAKEPVFNVIGGRHPVVETTLREHAGMFVKNDCELNEKRIALLTGPNMSGKSTYLRQNALIVVLAHLGSFVPAESAEIGIADQLFSRVGASDNLASGQSTFMVEMSETANILNHATPKSFIIFDEIGRGTATFDGMAIARAVLEYTGEIGARCLFATHYHELTETKPANVKNLTIKIAESDGEIIFMHKIIDGTADRSYGIHVAKMAGMPETVLESAARILTQLENRENEQKFAIGPDLEQDEQLSLF